MSQSKFAIGIIALAMMSQSCDRVNQMFKSKKELSSNITLIQEGKGSDSLAKVGDFVSIRFSISTTTAAGKDTLMNTSSQNGPKPVVITIQPAPFKGSPEDALTQLHEGDSALISVPVDSFARGGMPLPPMFRKGQKLSYNIRMVKIISQKDSLARKEVTDKSTGLKEDSLLKSLVNKFAPNAVSVTPLPSGLIVAIIKQGNGAKPAAGDTAFVEYTGKFVSGQVFDKSEGRPPMPVAVGTGMVIPAWDQGLLVLPQGTKAVLFAPSRLAYGASDPRSPIPPYSPLIFEVNIVKVKVKK